MIIDRFKGLKIIERPRENLVMMVPIMVSLTKNTEFRPNRICKVAVV